MARYRILIIFEMDGEPLYGYITEDTFNVPAVSGHNGSDYGKIEEYNIRTGKWEEVACKTTTTSGYVKYTCDVCGSWAQINVQALPHGN